MDLNVPTRFDERDWTTDVSGGPLRIAVVGLGGFARNTALPCIEESDHCAVGAVVSGDAEKAERVADEYDAEAAMTYEEYGDGEAADAYDAVYVVTPNALHLPHVETAAELDKAVLCEKPIEATAERARQLVEVCEEAGVPLMSAYRMQTTRSVRWVRDLVQEGVIGDPVRVDGEFSFDILAGDGDPNQWRIDRDLAGGGALMDIGVYPMNTARFVLDEDPTAVRATAHATRDPFEGVDEHVAFQLDFPGAVTAQCAASFGAAFTSRFAVIGREGRIEVEPIFGVHDDRRVTVEVGGDRTVVEAEEPHEVTEEFDYFAAAVLGDGEINPDGPHGLFDVRITEAVYEADETGGTVDL